MPHPLLLPLRKSYFFRRVAFFLDAFFFLLARSAMTFFVAARRPLPIFWAAFLAFFMTLKTSFLAVRSNRVMRFFAARSCFAAALPPDAFLCLFFAMLLTSLHVGW